jgi:hypothetical protein
MSFLMDDDIEIESEALFRTVSLFSLARRDFALGGHMLDPYGQPIFTRQGRASTQAIWRWSRCAITLI